MADYNITLTNPGSGQEYNIAFAGAPEPTWQTKVVKVYNGSTWDVKPVKRYSGTVWETKSVKALLP